MRQRRQNRSARSGTELDTDLAERAFIQGNLDAVVELLLSPDLLNAPVWRIDSALVHLLRHLAPGVSDADLAAALGRHRPTGRWKRVQEILEGAASS